MKRTILALALTLVCATAGAGDLSIIVSGQWLEKTGEDEFEGELEESQLDFDFDVGGALGVGLLYEWNEHWGLETKASFGKMDVTVRTFLSDAEFILELDAAEIIPLTAVVQYRFRPNQTWTPYVGAGVAHVIFRDLEFGSESINFDDDTGLVVNAGVDLTIGDRWVLNADFKHVPFESGLTGARDLGAGELEFKPVIASAGLRYRF
ncbi:MAG: outer membrane beta-barrel protein [Acidobacteria bacterium]|nr:outer membrane beta-barrel protein [Acidobacteriota bacterium]